MSVKIDGLGGELGYGDASQPHSKIEEFDTYYEQAYSCWNPFFPEADTDLRFYLGDQWDDKEKWKLFNEGRSTYVFNRVRRSVNLVDGYQRKNRLTSVVVPIEGTDQQVADDMTGLLWHAMRTSDGYKQISDAFSGALKTGINLLSLWIDYREDPIDGDIRITREPYNGFILDPYFTQLDFSDCQFILRRRYLSLDHVKSLLPGHSEKLDELYKIGWDRDDKFTWLPYQQQPNGQSLMAYNEMYVQKWREIYAVVDKKTGTYVDWEGSKKRLNELLKLFPFLTTVKRSKRYIERSIIVNDQLIESSENPYGLNDYPFVPVVAVFEPESEEWELKIQSLIRCMRDPQKESNRRRSQMVDILDSQINSGWIATENSVVNPHSLFQSSQGRVVWRREDAQPGALEKIPPAQIPPSMFQMQEMFDKDIIEIAGVNEASFGVAESGNESGVMMMLRQGAAVVNLQNFFDNLRSSQKALSQKMLTMMRDWSPEKMARILGHPAAPAIHEKASIKYDVDITEGVLTDTQRQMYFRQLVDLRQLGAPVTAEMLAKAAPIQGKSEYLRELQQAEQSQAQQQQQAQQLQNMAMQMQMQSSEAKAISDQALAKERYTRAIANLGLQEERNAKSIQDRSQSTLDRVRAIKELQAMDDDRLFRYLEIIRAFESSNRLEESQDKLEDAWITEQAPGTSLNFALGSDRSPQPGQFGEMGGMEGFQ